MYGCPMGTQERITSAHIEEHADVSGEIKQTTEQEVWRCRSPGDAEEVDRPKKDTEEEASQKPNKDPVEEEARSRG
ncbi:hypothetical protein NDU88_001254 [Pleurodeles waltl]|uniref:Uncharacterized protein n=1 Tax=Pleurodeles waltl TaxID=8319 RepID=A0AAV7P6G9_PLEWA|nr:hypothetical protein NDU88_001254 [Pleurodeles waltl]